MGEYLDKWLPELKRKGDSNGIRAPSDVLTDEQNRKYTEKSVKCLDCGKEFMSRTYYLVDGSFTFKAYCPECKISRAQEFEQQEQTAARTEMENTRESWRQSCGVPAKYQTAGFENFEKGRQPRAFRICSEYAAKFPLVDPRGFPSLVLFSERSWGTGKTHLASAITHEILNRWSGQTRSCPVKFISEPELFEQLRETYNYTRHEQEELELPSERDILQSCIHARLLILDDLGKEEVADLKFVQRILFVIFNGRYNLELPVVVTANLDEAGLHSHMGGSKHNEASFDRLIEMCKGEFVQMDGDSYRIKNAGKGKNAKI